MKRNPLFFLLLLITLAAVLAPVTATAAPAVNSAVILPRVFNDCPGSTFTATNNYPALISMTDVNQGCFGFANLHLWRFSTDGVNPAEFVNEDSFRFCADVRITGSGAGEAGLQIAPWWSQSDGRLNVRTTDGEIAAFGGRLPFYSFSDPAGYNMHYVKGETVHLEVIYRPNGLSETDPATIEYRVNGNSSGPLGFDMGNPAENPPHGLWGILTPTQVGGHFQFFLNDSGPSGALTVDWANICYENLNAPLTACPEGLGFWRQQCAQKGNGSTKVCQAGMDNLWQCVLSQTTVTRWQGHDGSFTSASLGSMSDADVSSAFCSQLLGPRPMTALDKAEIQYLVLALNVCSGALSPQIQVSNNFVGTVGGVLDSLANAINSGMNYRYWTSLVENINEGMFLVGVEECSNADSLFANISPCTGNGHGDDGEGDEGDNHDGDDDHGGNGNGNDNHGSMKHSGVETRAYPNPTAGSSISIDFRVPDGLGSSGVTVSIFDLSGRLVKNVLSDMRQPGFYGVEWNLRDQSGEPVPSGIYFYRVTIGIEQVTQKLLITQ